MAMVLHSGGKYALGETFYRRAIARNRSFRWLYYLSQNQTLAGKKNEAAETLRSALELDSRYVPARLKLARLLLESGGAQEARQILEATLPMAPDSPVAEYELGRTYTALSQAPEALTHLERACQRLPEYGPAQYALAVAYRKQGRVDDAKAHFTLYEKHKDRLPSQPDPLESQFLAAVAGSRQDQDRAVEALQRGRLSEAVSHYESVVRKEPSKVAARASLIALYYKLGDYTKAEAQYRDVLRLDPRFYEAHYHYGMAQLAQQHAAEAEAAFRKALEIQPSHAGSLTQLGLLREKAGDDTQAVEHYHRALAAEPSQRQASFLLGRQLVRQRKFDEAIQHLEMTVKTDDEQTPWFLRALAGAQAEAGHPELGLNLAKQAREKAVARADRKLVQLLDPEIAALSKRARPQ